MNPHKHLGCEVNLCQAKVCTAERMQWCALRRAYLERVAVLEKELKKCRSEETREIYMSQLRGLEYEKIS